MPGPNKMGTPKHLEKMLFINHKEDIMLDDKLHELKLRSRYKAMELDRERIKVRNELRDSRKKNITLNEAIISGLLQQPAMQQPRADSRTLSSAQPALERQNTLLDVSRSRRPSNGRAIISAPAQRRQGTVERPSFSRSTSFAGGPVSRKPTTIMNRRLSVHPVIHEADESDASETNGSSARRDSADTVGEYVLCEFEKMSQVVPDILRALARKKEKQQEIDDRTSHKSTIPNAKDINLIDYEPDMNKVRKTVISVKTLRHRMAISKRLNSVKPQKSLEQMIKDKVDNAGDHDEYTDGTCALMKRRLEKKRRDSESESSDGQPMPRRHSMFGSINELKGNKTNNDHKSVSLNLDTFRQRSASVIQLPNVLSRQSTSLGFGSSGKLASRGLESESSAGGNQMIDEDVLRNRQRVVKELDRYQLIQERVDRFLIKGASKTPVPVFEEIVQIK